ncbi:TPA: hypothetical protein ACO4FT_004612 [Escherichia coli]|uniref:hypothetical protein n=1 Tax=Escherichia coli TaxID=562 RepID=UPI00135E6B3F|nr:hypothetical protein [Escherichia coli]EMF2439426.1 hypothetical protein [Escherichia coli]MXD51482.1 hypothetical protein [Escherichia coli]HCX7133256.1 hypothetical protein [Escherichia coli]
MNEKGVGLIEIAFVLILFTAVLPMSLYYVSLSKTISDSILLGELMDSYVSDIKMKYKTGVCNDVGDCIEKSTKYFNSRKSKNSLKIKVESVNNDAVLIYPDGKNNFSIDEIYVAMAGAKENLILVSNDGNNKKNYNGISIVDKTKHYTFENLRGVISLPVVYFKLEQ